MPAFEFPLFTPESIGPVVFAFTPEAFHLVAGLAGAMCCGIEGGGNTTEFRHVPLQLEEAEPALALCP